MEEFIASKNPPYRGPPPDQHQATHTIPVPFAPNEPDQLAFPPSAKLELGQSLKDWRAREDSNLQPDRYERYALPGKPDKI
jgi:hypothetical protein